MDVTYIICAALAEWDNVIYYEFENCRMIRTDDYKFTHRFPDGPNELYNLKDDPGERNNLRRQHPDIADRLLKRHDEWRASIQADPTASPPIAIDTP